MARLFGTDGVRGVAGEDLTAELAFRLGKASASVLTLDGHKPHILVGRDTRLSGKMLQSAIMAGICAVGGTAVDVGVLPTPGIAYLTKNCEATAGVVISASHNPMEFNGIKLFSGEGYKLPDSVEDEIEAILRGEKEGLPVVSGAQIGDIIEMEDASERYMQHILDVAGDLDLSGMHIVAGCANGASSFIAPKLFRKLGAEVTAIHCAPDGININDHCGSTHMESLQSTVTGLGADLGLAFDGDADRMLAVDENGQIVDGDQIMMACARSLKANGKLAKNTLVVTVMSNMGLTIAAKREKIDLDVTAVGDRYVLESMIEHGFCIGGEQSGHVIFSEYSTTGDGMLSAVCLLKVLKENGGRLSETASVMQVLPQVLVNCRIPNEKKYLWETDEVIQNAIREAEKQYEDRGRILIRASGTEPLVRVMIEGEDPEEIDRDAKALADVILGQLS